MARTNQHYAIARRDRVLLKTRGVTIEMTDKTRVTRYRVISDNTYKHPRGHPVRLVYATRTGKVVPVPANTADSLRAAQVPPVSAHEKETLSRLELLVNDDDELATVSNRMLKATASLARRHITLLPTSYCNMGCTYCGQTHRRIPIQQNHREAVRRRVMRVLESPTTEEVRLDWFGAEPLMGYAIIRDLAASFIPIVEQRNLKWSSMIITNGALLDKRKIKVLAQDCRVTHAEITIDGPPEIHDTHRPLKSGGTSFWRIVDAIASGLADDKTNGMTFGIRTNVDVHNEDRVEELLRLLADQGFAHPRVRFGIKPVHSWGNDVRAIELGKRHFAEREHHWLNVMHELGLHFETLPTEPVSVLCPAVSQSDELIDSQGNVFSCSEQPLVDHLQETAVGNMTQPWTDGADPRPIGLYDDWHQDVVEGSRSCSSCEFYPVCGGACPKLWSEGHVPCPSFKFNTQERLDLVAKMNGFLPITEGSPS
jgi:uncharacterized protein